MTQQAQHLHTLKLDILHHESWSANHQEDKEEGGEEDKEEDQDDRQDREEDKEEVDKLVLVWVEGFYCFRGDNMVEIAEHVQDSERKKKQTLSIKLWNIKSSIITH